MRRVFSMRYLSFMFSIVMLHGCARDHIISRPTIEKDPDWKMVESCGYEGCTPMVDFLSTRDIRIKIEAFDRGIKPQLFVILIAFVGSDFFYLKSKEFSFDPSAVTVGLISGKTLKPKVFTCSYTIWDLQHMRSKPSLSGQIPITNDNSCFVLFFDYPPPPVEEIFTMHIEGLKKKGIPINIPTVIFKKGISRY